jgi:hypothetical protein
LDQFIEINRLFDMGGKHGGVCPFGVFGAAKAGQRNGRDVTILGAFLYLSD